MLFPKGPLDSGAYIRRGAAAAALILLSFACTATLAFLPAPQAPRTPHKAFLLARHDAPSIRLCPTRNFMSSTSPSSEEQQQQQQQQGQSATTTSTMSQQHNFMPGVVKPKKTNDLLPTMIVFDLDDCLWSPEMYTLHDKPSIPEYGNLATTTTTTITTTNERGVVGLKVPPTGPTVRLFPGARHVLRELALNPIYAGIVLAAASSSEEPSYSHACLQGIEILPQLTLRQMMTYAQIGRTGPLSPDKRTHFRLLHQQSKVPYEEMLFFDDCNWGDHCWTVSREFGVVSQRTPAGLQYSEFQQALETYQKEALQRRRAAES